MVDRPWIDPGIRAQALLVSLADKACKSRQQTGPSSSSSSTSWQMPGGLASREGVLEPDDVLGRLADDNPTRLAHQARHPVSS